LQGSYSFDTVKVRAPDLIIMPGLAFDQDGHRLGWGKAYYDTYLMSAENKHNHVLPLRIAAALDGQIIDKVPHDSHDVKADCILTPSELLCIDKRRSEQFISV
jgi:5-formyltetrahydrofolate cyclo-ligase